MIHFYYYFNFLVLIFLNNQKFSEITLPQVKERTKCRRRGHRKLRKTPSASSLQFVYWNNNIVIDEKSFLKYIQRITLYYFILLEKLLWMLRKVTLTYFFFIRNVFSKWIVIYLNSISNIKINKFEALW